MTRLDLRSRPLTPQDRTLYVERGIDSELRLSLQEGNNVVLGARRGAGTTSLLLSLASTLPGAVYVNGEYAETGEELLASLLARLEVPRSLLPDVGALTQRPDPLGPPREIRVLREQLREGNSDGALRPVFLIDGPLDADVAFSLFGRWRDEMFGIPATWLVVAHEDRLRQYVTPPADVFFDGVLTLADFDRTDASSVLLARGAWDELSTEWRQHVLEVFDGTPRHLLRLARQGLAPGGPRRPGMTEGSRDPTTAVGRREGMLLAEMQGRDAVTATDADLQRRLGVGERQLRRALSRLEESGYVQRVPGGSGTPGRPATAFQLTSEGSMWMGVA